jgi:hypothetical protein
LKVNGRTEMWVSGAGASGSVPTSLKGQKVHVVNPAAGGDRVNDAERHLLREAKKRGAEIQAIGATNNICDTCESALAKVRPSLR